MAVNLLRTTLARKWVDEGRKDQAIELLEKSLKEVRATKYIALIAEFRSVLAELKFAKGDVDAAEEHANAAIALGDDINESSSQSLVSAYHTLYLIAQTRSQPVAALDFYQHFAEAEKRYLGDVKAREIAYEMVRQETEQKNQELKRVQRENSLLHDNQQKTTLAIILLLVALAVIALWAAQIKRHQSQLRRLAQTDMLTGIGNRHYFTQKSERALLESARDGEISSLVMFDLDHFKAINDTYGHGAGDWVLKNVAKACAAHCRKVDYLGRLGGEEFAILLRGLDLSSATRMAEDCRAKLAQIDTRDCGYTFVVTASFGLTSTAQSGYDLSRLLSHADQMLYRAKNEGRNRVCAYTAEAASEQKSKRATPSLMVVGS